MLKKIALAILALIVLLVAVVAINTVRQGSRQLKVAPVQPVAVDADAAARRLSAAIRLQTISSAEKPELNAGEFKKLHALLEQSFPRTHAALKREIVGGGTLMYIWQGSNPQAKPVALMAHQDVVPIASGTEGSWQAEPFGGEIKDGFVWGRGAWDDKGNLFAQMEAVEKLVSEGFQPARTVYLIFGHDEEVGGHRGAVAVAALLKSRGVHFEWVLDEGLLITEGVLPGLKSPSALVGVAEKGYGSYLLSLDAQPGHSSMPPRETAIGMMSTALARLEDKQMPAAIRGAAAAMFDTLAPEMSGSMRVLLSNLWLFGPLVKAQLEKGPSSNAMLRTTTALTMINAGNKDNVLPGHVEATVNFRLLPGDTLEGVEKHVKTTIANDTIAVKQYPGNSNPSPVSPTESTGYRAIERTVRELMPDVVVAPGLMIGATDGRHLAEVSDSVYRFSPVRARPEDLPRFHGTNERISIANFVELIQFYHRLLRNGAAS